MSVTYSTQKVLKANATTIVVTNLSVTGTVPSVISLRLVIYDPVDNLSGPFTINSFNGDDLPISSGVAMVRYSGNSGNAGINDLYAVLQRNTGKYAWIEYSTDAGSTWQGIGDPLSTISPGGSQNIPAGNTATFYIETNNTTSFNTPLYISPSATTITLPVVTLGLDYVWFKLSCSDGEYVYSTVLSQTSPLTLTISNFRKVMVGQLDFYSGAGSSLSTVFSSMSGSYASLEYSGDDAIFFGFGTPLYRESTPYQPSSRPAGNVSSFSIQIPPLSYTTLQTIPANASTIVLSNIDGFTGNLSYRLSVFDPVDTNVSQYTFPGSTPDTSLPVTRSVLDVIRGLNVVGGERTLYQCLQANIGKYASIEYSTDDINYSMIGSALSAPPAAIPAENTASFLIGANTTAITFNVPQLLSTTATSFSITNFTGHSGNIYFRLAWSTTDFLSYPAVTASSSLTLPFSNFYELDYDINRDMYANTVEDPLNTLFIQGREGIYGSIDYSTDGHAFYRIGVPAESPTLTSIPEGNTATFLVGTPPPPEPPPPCFLEGSQILCVVNGVETYLPVEQLRKGTLVKTLYGVKPLAYIGSAPIKNPGTSERISERLYKLSPSAYPELSQDLFLTGAHAILVNKITDIQRAALMKEMKDIYVTDKKYRLAAFIDERAEPWASEGTYTIYHFALEHENRDMNYGVYANGLLVESCCISFLLEHLTMKLL